MRSFLRVEILVCWGFFSLTPFLSSGCHSPSPPPQPLPCVEDLIGPKKPAATTLWFFSPPELRDEKQVISLFLLEDRLKAGVIAVVAPQAKRVYFLASEDGHLLKAVQTPELENFLIPAAGDLDRDGKLELVFATGERAFALTTQGARRWDVGLPFPRTTRALALSPLLLDLDGDGGDDLVTYGNAPAPGSDGVVAIQGYTGRILWSYNDPDLDTFADFLDLALVEGGKEGRDPLVLALTPRYLLEFLGSTGALRKRLLHPYSPITISTVISQALYSPYALPLLGPLLPSGEQALLLATTSTVELYPLPLTMYGGGSTGAAVRLSLPPIALFPSYGKVQVADLNGDGFLELIRQGNRSPSVYYFENRRFPEGDLLWVSEDLQNPLQGVMSFLFEPSLLDFNGDGIVDLGVYAFTFETGQPSLMVLSGWDGSLLFAVRCLLSPFYALGDFRNTGKLALAYFGYSRGEGGRVPGVVALSFDLPFPPPRLAPWPRFGHDLRHSRVMTGTPLPP